MPALRRRRFALWSVPVLLVAAYAVVLGWFSLREDAYVYFPRKSLHPAPQLPNATIERVQFRADDGVNLVAWKIVRRDSVNWILFLHGNGGNISSRGAVRRYELLLSTGVNILALDYRGYGESGGEPSEQGLYLDGLAAFRYLTEHLYVPATDIVLYGHSLGSAVAIHVASVVEAGGVIVEGAFSSAPDAGSEMYPFLPTQLMMKNRFDSYAKMHLVTEPKLFFHSPDDAIVPIALGRKLFEAAPEPKAFVETRGGHDAASAADADLLRKTITQFLRTLK